MILTVVILSILSVISVFGNVWLSRMLFRIQDNCQHSLNYIDQRYETLSQMMEDNYLTSNDPIAHKFVTEIRLAMNGIAFATNVLKSPADNIESVILEMEKEEMESKNDGGE